MRHPSHFKILSARDQIDLDGSMALRNSIGEVRALTEQTLAEAQQQGEVDSVHKVTSLALLSRATAYGLARMQHDGHLGQWGVAAGDEAAAMTGTLDLLIALMRRVPA